MVSPVRTWFGRGLDQDWVDLANGFWSVLLLAVCSVGAFFIRYITDPITCFCPAHFTGAHVSYTKHTCFLKEQYFQSINPDIEVKPDPGVNSPDIFSYHLWIPIILFFQALCFKIPDIIWSAGKHCLTMNLEQTVESLKQAQVTNDETRKSVFQAAARLFGKLLEGNKFFLAILYLFVKLLYCLNLLGQLVFLTIYFRNTLLIKAGSYISFDINAYIKPLLAGHVICEFQLRKISNVENYTIQCILPITEIYEKLFVFLWYWVFLLAVVSVFNLLLWAGFLFLPFLRDRRISAYINARSPQDSSTITRFVSGFLGIDGVLVLSMISRNSSEMVAADLSQQMYQVFLEKGNQYQPVPSTSARETTVASAPIRGDIPMENLNYRGPYPEKPLMT